MHRGSTRFLLSWVFVGLWSVACGGDSAPRNQPPNLTGPTAQTAEVHSGTPVALSLEATDPDGDALTYDWGQAPPSPAGSFSDASSATPTWTAPQVTVATSFQVGVTVSDGKNGPVHRSVTVQVHPPLPTNRAPAILQAPTASPASVIGAAPVQLSVSASDPDADTLTYTWTQTPADPAGTFTRASSATPTWTAPGVTSPRRFALKVSVSDGKGGTTSGTVDVDVAPPVPQNRAPTLTAPTATPSTLDEQTSTQLSVSASDADGDPLTYAWSQVSPASPVGTFSSTSVANPTWKAPDVNANGVIKLRVTVSDGRGGNVQGTVDLNVRKVNRPPTVGGSISGPSTLLAGDTGTFSLTASDPDGDPLTWSWTQSAPATQGTFVGSTTGSSAQWFSPALSTQTSFTLSVTVTDGQSSTVTRTFTVPVTVPHYTDVQQTWEAVPCTSCHGQSGGLNLREGASYGELINVNANACGLKRVVPGDPNNSALVLKMEGNACGPRMPSNDQAWFDDNPGMVVRVRSWILAGAANN